MVRQGKVVSCRTPENGGVLASVLKMALGNGLGFAFEDGFELAELADIRYGSFIAELSEDLETGRKLGVVTETPVLTWRGETADVKELRAIGRDKLEKVYPTLNPEWTLEDRGEADACWPAARKA